MSIASTFSMAVQYHQQGNFPQAEQLYRQVLQAEPKHVGALHLFGVLAHQAGHGDVAIPYIMEALRLQPDMAEAHSNLGNIYRDQGKLDEAAASYERALRLKPNLAGTRSNLGNIFKEQGKLDEAVRNYEDALKMMPEFAEGHRNLAGALQELGKLNESLASYRQAVRYKPDDAQALTSMANVMLELGMIQESITTLNQALKLGPDQAEAHATLGNALMEQGNLAEAAASSQRALRLEPNYAAAQCSLGFIWLLQGNYELGWPAYEWRWKCKEFKLPSYVQQLWDGSPLLGRSILLHAEQGMGDTIQFIRYAALVKERGGKVLLACQPRLVELLGATPGIEQVVKYGTLLHNSDFDAHVPLMSLPAIFRTTAATVPAKVPYIFADPALTEKWRAELSQVKAFKIGIAWQGDPKYRRDRQRSIPLAKFAPLAQVPGVQLYSLQKGPGAEQLAQLAGRFPIIDLASRLDETTGGFMDTAAVMKTLDLVISSDTAAAHLAGALGVPVWVALSKVPEWRWMLEREDSPWYPTMRLFRQTEAGNWDGVFARMAAEVMKLKSGPKEALLPRLSRPIRVEIAAGELIDKITILKIKQERMTDAAKLANVGQELKVLEAVHAETLPPSEKLQEMTRALKAVNEKLWQVEDDIRLCEHNGDFGPRFIELARSVYEHNDHRSLLKRRINDLLGSRLVEEKQYTSYAPPTVAEEEP